MRKKGQFFFPTYDTIVRLPKLTFVLNASTTDVGGYRVVETGWLCQYFVGRGALSLRRVYDSHKSIAGINDIIINVLELLGVLVGAQSLVVSVSTVGRRHCRGMHAVTRVTNETCVAWVQSRSEGERCHVRGP